MYSNLIDHIFSFDGIFKALKDFANSVCKFCTTKAIDAKLLGEALTTKDKIPTTEVVDGIFFPNSNEMFFLQMKEWESVQEMENEIVDSNELKAKINGTIGLLNRIVRYCGIEHSYKEFHDSILAHPIPTIVLTEVPVQDYAKFRLANYPHLNLNERNAVIGEIKFMSCERFHKGYAA